MAGEAVAVAEQFLAELRAGEQQITEINNRMNQVRSKADELRARADEGLEQIKERVRQLLEHIETRSNDVGGRFDALEEEIRALGGVIEQGVQEFIGEQSSTRDMMQNFVGAVDEGRGEIERRRDQLVSDVEGFTTFAKETYSTLDDDDSTASETYHSEVKQTKSERQSSIDQLAQTKESKLQDQMQRYSVDRLAEFGNHVRSISERVRQNLERSSSQLDSRFQEQVSQFTQSDQDRRQRLTQESSSLADVIRGLGQNMDTLTTTMVEGGDSVNELMQGTSVGIRMVIEIFQNIMSIMDEILAEA